MTFNPLCDTLDDIDSIQVSTSYVCDPEGCRSLLRETGQSLNIITQNICSISANLPGFLTLLTRTKLVQDVIVLTECWLSCNPNIPAIEGYSSFHSTNRINKNDGVVVYIRNNTASCRVFEPQLRDANCVAVAVDQETCIVGIYRPPCFRDVAKFLESLDSFLTTHSAYKNLVLIGDINIDITKSSTNNNTKEYLNITASHGLLPAHTITTRDKSCLDHVILKSKHRSTVLVLEVSVTDHRAVLLSMTRDTYNNVSPKTLTEIDPIVLEQCITSIDYTSIYQTNNANDACTLFINYLTSAMDNSTSIRIVPSRLRIRKPWITPGLLRCMRNRDLMYKKMKKNPNNETLKITFRRYRNFCNNLLKNIKRQYEKDMLTKANGNPKRLWSAIKSITQTSKKTQTANELLCLESNPVRSINTINNYFVNVGKNLAESLVMSNDAFVGREYIKSTKSSFVFLETDEAEVESIITNLRSNCAVGIDGISTNVLKQFKATLVRPLTYIMNLCISTGVFPDHLKKALVHPIHKSGDKQNLQNYRPISVLSSLSKILERIMNKRLKGYLESNNLLSDRQYGFRNSRSTDNAVHDLTNYIAESLDKKQKCLAIFLDLAKAFDTVSLSGLCIKLEKLGIRGNQLKLFQSYLSNRTQCTRVGELTSSEIPVLYGVPQGSILGPTLFLVYINDMCDLVLKGGKIVAFADDTALIFRSTTWQETYEAAQLGFNQVTQWLTSNKLTLNINKTTLMKFKIRNSTSINHNYKIAVHSQEVCSDVCNCPSLTQTSVTRYLGILLDDHMSFQQHIESLCGRVRKLMYVFKHLRHVADPNVMKMVYYALCQSILEYCISAWGGASKSHLIHLERAQRAVLKVCTFQAYRFPTKRLYEYCEVLTVRQIFILKILLKQHTNKSHTERSPLNLLAQVRTNRKHRIPLRSTCTTSFGHRFYFFLGRFLYNKINNLLVFHNKTKHESKKLLTSYLLTLSYEDTEAILHPPK